MKNKNLIVDAQSGKVWNKIKNGDLQKVGFFDGKRYLRCQIDGAQIYLHRFIYSFVHGPISPHFDIDHINGNGLDNRIENLRLSTKSQNQQNRQGAQKNSTTGIRGVYWHKNKNKYMSKIKHEGKNHFLGYFSETESAKAAYIKASLQLHTHSSVLI